jgi:hypothetical protein
MAGKKNPADNRNRSPYRDNDDQRDPLPPEGRADIKSDSKTEARGDARERVGNNARGTDRLPIIGPEGNDKTRRRPRSDVFDEDLRRK